MATKRQLQQAMSYSRKRAATALMSGRPEGRELAPSRPLRPVIAGMVLAAMVVVGSIVVGLIKPSLPKGWESSSLVLASDSGARYAAVDGVLYAVPNAVSARLIIPAASFSQVTTSESRLADLPRGRPIGIAGAPAALPPQSHLVHDGWAACPVAGKTAVLVGARGATVSATTAGALVSQGDDEWLVVGSTRYQVAAARRDAVVRALGMERTTVVPVTAAWLNLYRTGSPLDAPGVEGVGVTPSAPLVVGGVSVPAGAVVSVGHDSDATDYVLTATGELAPMSPLARDLYLLTAPSHVSVDPTAVAGRATAPVPVGPTDWPPSAPSPLGPDVHPCGALVRAADGTASTTLATLTTSATPAEDAAVPYLDDGARLLPGVFVRPGYGAVVRATPQSGTGGGATLLIDDSGQAFPVPDPSDETLARLGYAPTDVAGVPQAWVALFPPGASLSAAAAGAAVVGVPPGDQQ